MEVLGEWPEEVTEAYAIAPWSNEIKTKFAPLIARIESITEKPAFRYARNTRQRCIIPALGYCQWKTERGAKQPNFCALKIAQLYFLLASEPHREDDIPSSCLIITQAAEEGLSALHTRR